GTEAAGFLALLALVAVPLVFGLLQNNVFVRTSFETATLRKEKLALQERYRQLCIERATLESLSRIESEAKRQGLMPPEKASQVLYAPSLMRPDHPRTLRRAEEASLGASGQPPIASLAPAELSAGAMTDLSGSSAAY